MTLLTARRLIDTVIIFLILSHIVAWVEGLSPSVVSILVSLTYLLSYRMARHTIEPTLSYYVWMWMPTILFVVAPLVWELRSDEETTLLSSAISALPLFSLILPVGMLFIVRAILVRHYSV